MIYQNSIHHFADGKYDGFGKYFFGNGEYYVGGMLKGLKHGKGEIFYSNGFSKNKGNYVNDRYMGEYIDNDIYLAIDIHEPKNNNENNFIFGKLQIKFYC